MGDVINCKDSTARTDIATKAPKSEAIKNITRSGTTFTATRCDDTTFTFTQQDNNTTTGTTYTAGNVPANTTFGTNGSIKNAYDNLKLYNTCPEYGSQVVNSGDKTPTSNVPYTHTCGNEVEIIYISYWKATAGNSLLVTVNNISVYGVPAYTAGFGTMQLVLLPTQVLKITTDTTSTGWTVNVRGFKHALL